MRHHFITFLLMLLFFMSLASGAVAKEASPMQFFFIVKQVFPDNPPIAVFMSETTYKKQEKSLNRAAAQAQLKPKLYLIKNSSDIGKRMRDLKPNTILIVFESEVMLKKNTMLYILSKCKENAIRLVTSSQDYTDRGALLGLLYNQENKLQVVLNLKHNDELKPVFSEEFIQVAGINQVIE